MTDHIDFCQIVYFLTAGNQFFKPFQQFCLSKYTVRIILELQMNMPGVYRCRHSGHTHPPEMISILFIAKSNIFGNVVVDFFMHCPHLLYNQVGLGKINYVVVNIIPGNSFGSQCYVK